MAVKLPTVLHLAVPYNLSQGEARVNKKKDHHRNVKRKGSFFKMDQQRHGTFVVGVIQCRQGGHVVPEGVVVLSPEHKRIIPRFTYKEEAYIYMLTSVTMCHYTGKVMISRVSQCFKFSGESEFL